MDAAARTRLRELADRATPGPWMNGGVRDKFRLRYSEHTFAVHIVGPDADAVAAVFFEEKTGRGFNDAQFIAASRAAVPDLLDEIDRLEAEIEQHHAKSTCCCGNYMTEHGLGDGHSPVSMYDYALDQTQSQLETARWQIGQQIKVISSESDRADRSMERAERAEAALREVLVYAEQCWLNHYGDNPESGPAPPHIAEARAVLAEVPT